MRKPKYIAEISSKKFATILKVDQRRTPTNGPENKKTHDNVEGLTPQK